MREYIDVLESAFAAFRNGDLVPFEGSQYRLLRLQKYFNPGPDELTVTPPIWIGGVNERMTKLAGERASGFMTHSTNSHPKYIRDKCLPALSAGASSAGRDLASIPIIAGSCFITARSAEEIMAKRETQRRKFAFLYSTPAYGTTLELLGYVDLGERLRAMVRSDNWDELDSVVTDDVLDEVQPSASYEELPALVTSRLSGLVSGFVLDLPYEQTDDDEFRDTIKAIQTIN
jgi:alkanesulfonate monooxygenase SsuD/methylene tetrahydromethanopterin reductase-like flavin-dependent oxidoreductase (luciferase family)